MGEVVGGLIVRITVGSGVGESVGGLAVNVGVDAGGAIVAVGDTSTVGEVIDGTAAASAGVMMGWDVAANVGGESIEVDGAVGEVAQATNKRLVRLDPNR